jgi:hypothetical protein
MPAAVSREQGGGQEFQKMVREGQLCTLLPTAHAMLLLLLHLWSQCCCCTLPAQALNSVLGAAAAASQSQMMLCATCRHDPHTLHCGSV